MFGAPAMSPSTASGVGTVFDAGKYSVSGELKNGSVVYFLIFAVYASSIATLGSRIRRTLTGPPGWARESVVTHNDDTENKDRTPKRLSFFMAQMTITVAARSEKGPLNLIRWPTCAAKPFC